MKTDKDLTIELNSECGDHLTTIKILKEQNKKLEKENRLLKYIINKLYDVYGK